MTTSNTKLTREQKDFFKNLKYQNPEIQFFSFPEFYATVAIKREFSGSRMARVSVSYCAMTEQRFRRKVGQYHAATKMLAGEFIKVPTDNYFSMGSLASNFATL